MSQKHVSSCEVIPWRHDPKLNKEKKALEIRGTGRSEWWGLGEGVGGRRL